MCSKVILVDPSGAPAVLEFRHNAAPMFRALIVFDSTNDAFVWLDEQPEAAKVHWVGYAPLQVRDLSTIVDRYRAAYHTPMSVVNMSPIMRAELGIN